MHDGLKLLTSLAKEHLWDILWTIVTVACTGLSSLITWWWNNRKLQKTEAARQISEQKRLEAEAELRDIRRRGEAPYLVADDGLFQTVYLPGDHPDAIEYRQSHFPDLLSRYRLEVDTQLPKGQRVIFLIQNNGVAARRIRMQLDGASSASLAQEPNMNGAGTHQFLIYPYDPAIHGKEQRLTISFETNAGVRDTHVYLTRHGVRHLERIDPA